MDENDMYRNEGSLKILQRNAKSFFSDMVTGFGRGASPASRLISCVAILLVLLLVGGRTISKLKVFGPLYFIDLSFILLTLIVLIGSKFKLAWPVYLFSFVIIFTIFVTSLFGSNAPLEIIFRQLVLFVYPFSCYVIVVTLIRSNKIDALYRMLVGIAALSVVFQMIFLVLLVFTGGYAAGGFNYLSPLVVCGFIVWACYLFTLNGFSSLPHWCLLLIVSLSFGHSSAVLAIAVIPFFYLLFRSEIKYRLGVLLLMAGTIASIFLAYPDLIDVNASWRLSYWTDALERLSESYNWLTGFGFGELYANDNTGYIFKDLFGHDNGLSAENEGYYKAFHNSYVTIFFHVGVVGVVFLLPQANSIFISHFWYKGEIILVSTMSICALSVWASLNVILELPHSAHYFWFLFFISFYCQKLVLKNNEVI